MCLYVIFVIIITVYGSGMLFMCGGKAAFKRDPVSIGLILMAVCPWFPGRAVENKSHLQVRNKQYTTCT